MAIKLVVGLGNPGKKYEHTRHNIGARVLKGFEGQGPKVNLPKDVQIVTPADGIFMNECGPRIVSLARKFGCSSEEILIVCDDFMLPYSQLRIRAKGSSGGHN